MSSRDDEAVARFVITVDVTRRAFDDDDLAALTDEEMIEVFLDDPLWLTDKPPGPWTAARTIEVKRL